MGGGTAPANQPRLSFAGSEDGEAEKETCKAAKLLWRPTTRTSRPVRAQLTEPPYADPHVRWCGRGEWATTPLYRLAGTLLGRGRRRREIACGMPLWGDVGASVIEWKARARGESLRQRKTSSTSLSSHPPQLVFHLRPSVQLGCGVLWRANQLDYQDRA